MPVKVYIRPFETCGGLYNIICIYLAGNRNADDLYAAVPSKRKHQKHASGSGADGNSKSYANGTTDEVEYDEEKGKKEDVDGFEDKDANKDLPPGWEKHEGTDILENMVLDLISNSMRCV